MPTYTWSCQDCDTDYSVVMSMANYEATIGEYICMTCEKPIPRTYTSPNVVLNGPDFARNQK